MTLALVHGNPETARVWDRLVDALGRTDVVRLSPPGFGARAPEGWRATPAEYRAWLVRELEALGRPVDLVGHDWGAVHVAGVATSRPDLLRSWCTDSLHLLHPDYVWHSIAGTWQTPGAGERSVAAMTGPNLERRAAHLVEIGVREDIAALLAPGCAEVSARCVLELYRSAVQPVLADLGRELPAAAARPGLVLSPTADGGERAHALRLGAAALAGAAVEVLEGVGHWWMLEDPGLAAARLERFWSHRG